MGEAYPCTPVKRLPLDVFSSFERRPSFTIAEVAALFGITVQSVHQWVRERKIRRLSRSSEKGKYLIPRMEVVRLLKEAGREVPGLWERPSKPKERILVIDGYPLLRKMLRKVFRISGVLLEVKTAGTAGDGMLLAGAFRPHVILVSFAFRKGSLHGDQVIEAIRNSKILRNAVLIGMSADPGALAKMLRAGADAVLEKPFGLEDLRKVMLPWVSERRSRFRRGPLLQDGTQVPEMN